jgi:hypothetical protein
MADLPLRRLVHLLNVLASQCASVCLPDGKSQNVDLKAQVRWWSDDGGAFYSAIEEAAGICDQHGLVNAADRLRRGMADVITRQTDIWLHDMSRDWNEDELAFYTKEYGSFPLPLSDVARTQICGHSFVALFARPA